MRLSSLQSLCEGAIGYHGGPAVDTMPGISLDEAAGMLPVAIMESQMELSQVRGDNLNALTEAAGAAITYGTELDVEHIVEAGWDNIKKKVTGFFQKIITFIKSIIAKLKVQIDKIFKNGRALYEKYKDSPNYRGKEPKDLTCSGYEFEHGDSVFDKDAADYASKESAEKLFDEAVGSGITKPDALNAATSRGADDDSVVQKDIDKINDIGVAERQCKMAQFIAGSKFSLSEGTWASDLRKELWGEKKDIKYGDGPFTKSVIEGLLGKPDNLDKIRQKYEKMQKGAEAYEKSLQKTISDREKAMANETRQSDRDNANKSTDERSAARDAQDAKNRATSDVTAYFTAYMGLVHDAFGVITTMSNVEWEYQKARLAQAKTMFGKILSWNEKKNNSDASDVDEVDFIDADL